MKTETIAERMNAEILPVTQVPEIPVEQLWESPKNPRKHFSAAAMAELVESVRKNGVRVPLQVRPRLQGGGYEIGAGHRRYRAAVEAGCERVPCIVREMGDLEFLELLTFENKGREDVQPLEEAQAWRTYIDEALADVKTVAEKAGVSSSQVYARMGLLKAIPEVQGALVEGTIKEGHAVLLAPLAPKVQEGGLKFATTANWRGEKPSVRDLAEHLRQDAYLDLLEECPFDRWDRTLLAGAGDCDACPKRAANIAGFEFDPEDKPQPDLCTDRACHSQKVTNHLVRIKQQLTAKNGVELLEVSDCWGKTKKGVLKKDAYAVVTKAEANGKNVKAALVVDGVQIGKVIYVKVKPEEPKHSPAENKERQEKAEAERRAMVERELSVRRAILAAIVAKAAGFTVADLRGLLGILTDNRRADNFGWAELCRLHGLAADVSYLAAVKVAEALPKMPDAEINRMAIEALAMGDFCEWCIGQGEPEDLLALAKRYKVDAVKIRAAVEKGGMEAEGGTRKEVKAAPAKKSTAKKAPVKKAAAKKKGGKK